MPALRRWLRHIAYRERQPHPGDCLLGLAAAACFTAAACLAFLPAQLASGPALSVLYAIPGWFGLPGQHAWALVWAVLGIPPLVAVIQPTVQAREIAYTVLLPAGVCWTVGLAVPLFGNGPANFWAPLVWAFITTAAAVIWWLIPLDAPFYRDRNR